MPWPSPLTKAESLESVTAIVFSRKSVYSVSNYLLREYHVPGAVPGLWDKKPTGKPLPPQRPSWVNSRGQQVPAAE